MHGTIIKSDGTNRKVFNILGSSGTYGTFEVPGMLSLNTTGNIAAAYSGATYTMLKMTTGGTVQIGPQYNNASNRGIDIRVDGGSGVFRFMTNNSTVIATLNNTTGDFETTTDGSGYIANSPDGTQRKRIGIDNTGNVVATAVP